MKLAKRKTGRTQFIAAKNAYHGSTQGALSLLGVEEQKKGYTPLLPNIEFIAFNDHKQLATITDKTAAVILETIQGGAGFILPENDYLKRVKARCEEVGAMLILDEIQPGFGRTGKLFAFEHYGTTPDILVVGKGLGWNAHWSLCSSKENMELLTHDPALGHITTFGGNPVIAAAALFDLETIITRKLMAQIAAKEALFRSLLVHPKIMEIRGKGLLLANIKIDKRRTTSGQTLRRKRGRFIFSTLGKKPSESPLTNH